MENIDLILSFFRDKNDYMDFLARCQERMIANDEGTAYAQLIKKGNCFLYLLTWHKNGKYIGDYIEPFAATDENIAIFNNGCKILAERLKIYIETNNPTNVPMHPPAFGKLTHFPSSQN
jgi:hypothetical protein